MTEQQKEAIRDIYFSQFFESLDYQNGVELGIEKTLEILKLKVEGINE